MTDEGGVYGHFRRGLRRHGADDRRDGTARERGAQLAEQFDELQALYTEAPLGLALLDRDLRFVRINPALAEMNGFSVEDHLGRSAWDLVPGVRETAEPLLKRVIETGEPLRDVPVTGTTAAMPNVARYWTEHFYPLRDKAGTVQGIGIVCEEVTEKRHMEEALLEGEARLRALADNLPAGMIYQISTGADGSERRFLYVSQSHEKLTGVPAEDVLADPTIPYNLILPQYRGRLVEAEAEAIRTKTPFDVEARFRRSDGEVRWCRILSAPREQTDGSIIWDGIQIDTTEQKQAEAALRELNDTLESRVAERTADLERAHEQLRQSQKMEALGALTGGVAHDFNNLLTPIVGSLDLLQRKGLGGDREGRLIDGALQSAERAKTLVQRLLAFARRQPLQPKPVDLGSLVTGMADLVASTTGPQIKVIVDLADGLPAAVVDPNQVEMAILNLSVNARDAMEGGGTLRISAQDEAVGYRNKQGLKPGRYVRLSVADTGTGMDDATLRKAAEPFFSTKGVGRGTGLGLSMVHGLAEQLGGTLVIESKLGIGTNVEMWLPASDQEAAQADRAQEGEARLTTGTALLVDDEDLVRTSTADMLGELGYDVIEARCAEEALKIVDERRFFDLLVTDHLMPGMTGTELAREVRARLPDIKILVISGYAEVDGVAPDLNRLTKPFRQSDLAGMLGDLEETSSA